MNVPDDLLDFFARAKKAQGVSVSWTGDAVTLSCGSKSETVPRPCTMPQLEQAAGRVKR